MTDIDAVLRESFARAAEPGDPAGVAEAIRARMAAGDTGTPAETSGFGGSTGRVIPWLLGGALLVVGAVAITLAVSVLGLPEAPTGAALTTPAGQGSTPTITPSASSTPTQTPSASPSPTPTPTPTEAAPPVPAADMKAPTLSAAARTPDEVLAADIDYYNYCDITSSISVLASDDRGVVGVHISWSGVDGGSGEMTSGTTWTFVYNPLDTAQTGMVTFTMVARDAAGNTSAPATTTVKVWSAGNCVS